MGDVRGVQLLDYPDKGTPTIPNHWCHHSKPPWKSPQAMVGTWKDVREISGHCLATACDDTGNSATLGDSSTAWVDMCGLVIGDR